MNIYELEWRKISMEKNKIEEIEAKLREMISNANRSGKENRPSIFKSTTATVIRRRKGAQDLRVK